MSPFLVKICTNKTRKQYYKDRLETQKREDPTEREVMEILRIVEKGDRWKSAGHQTCGDKSVLGENDIAQKMNT